MKSLPNIEKSAFRRGEYVGYSSGPSVWRIRRTKGGWYAKPFRELPGVQLTARTLTELSAKLP